MKRIGATGPINRDNFEVDVSELPVLFYARLLADGGLFLFGFQDCCPQTSCGVEITLTGFYDAGGKDLFLRTVLDMWRQELERQQGDCFKPVTVRSLRGSDGHRLEAGERTAPALGCEKNTRNYGT